MRAIIELQDVETWEGEARARIQIIGYGDEMEFEDRGLAADLLDGNWVYTSASSRDAAGRYWRGAANGLLASSDDGRPSTAVPPRDPYPPGSRPDSTDDDAQDTFGAARFY